MTELTLFKIFDAHFHIIDGRFPLVPNNGYLPDTFTVADYLARLKDYRLGGGAVVSGSFQALDQTFMVDALQKLGAGFVGVTQLPAAVSDQAIIELDSQGVKAIRFNLRRGGSEGIKQLENMARRVFDLAGWHSEIYVDSGRLDALFEVLIRLPRISIDHLGLAETNFKALLKLAERGIKVKATGFGRVDLDVGKVLRALYSANPDCLMFGTDLPSTRAPAPYQDQDYRRLVDVLGREAAQKVFFTNARDFYGGGI